MGELRRRLHSCMPPPGMSAPDRGRAEVVAFFSAVLRTPAVLLLQHWQPEVFSTHRQELAALQQDVTKIVSELQQRGHQSKRPSAESEQLLQGVSSLQLRLTAMCTFGCTLWQAHAPLVQ